MGFKRRSTPEGGGGGRGRDAIGMIEACHARLDERMAALCAACDAAASGRAGDADRDAAAEVADYLERSLPRHVDDEEVSLFPRLCAADPGQRELTDALAREHRGHEALQAALLAQARDWLAGGPPPTGATAARLARAASALRAELAAHTRREDRDLVPSIRKHLGPDALADALSEMQTRRGH